MQLGKPNAKGQWEGGQGRRAYGWQRHGGHGEYILCDVETLIKLPDYLTYLDGAMIGKSSSFRLRNDRHACSW